MYFYAIFFTHTHTHTHTYEPDLIKVCIYSMNVIPRTIYTPKHFTTPSLHFQPDGPSVMEA